MNQSNVAESPKVPEVNKTGTAEGEQAERNRVRAHIARLWKENKDGLG